MIWLRQQAETTVSNDPSAPGTAASAEEDAQASTIASHEPAEETAPATASPSNGESRVVPWISRMRAGSSTAPV